MGRLRDWLRKLQKDEHMQVGGFYCYAVKNGHSHFHLLLLGDGTRNGHKITLASIDPQIWTYAWSRRRVLRGKKRPTDIRFVESSEGASNYLAMHNFEWKADNTEIYNYNGKLLKRFRKQPPPIGRRRPRRNCNSLQRGGNTS